LGWTVVRRGIGPGRGRVAFRTAQAQVTQRGVQSAIVVYLVTSPTIVRHFGQSPVRTQLEGLDPVRLQTVFLPDSVHRGPGTNPLSGSPARAPVCGALGRAQHRGHHRLVLGRADPARAATARLGAQRRKAALTIAPPRAMHSLLLWRPGFSPPLCLPKRDRWNKSKMELKLQRRNQDRSTN